MSFVIRNLYWRNGQFPEKISWRSFLVIETFHLFHWNETNKIKLAKSTKQFHLISKDHESTTVIPLLRGRCIFKSVLKVTDYYPPFVIQYTIFYFLHETWRCRRVIEILFMFIFQMEQWIIYLLIKHLTKRPRL